ncbi:MAG: DNA repair protein RecN [Rhodospirillales bacterium]
MLRSLTIRNVVLIEKLDLAFRGGLGVLTGETGSGKSILLDALGLALGARADTDLISAGADQGSATAEFELENCPAIDRLLADNDLADEGWLVLRRSISAGGRSRAFVNDRPVSAGLLRRIGEALVEIHGQLEAHGLLDGASHAGYVDAYGGHQKLLAATAAGHGAWRDAAAALRAAEDDRLRNQKDEEFLRHASAELAAIDAQPGEEEVLAGTRSALMHSEQLLAALNATAADLADGDTVEAALRAALTNLRAGEDKAGGRFDGALAALERALIELGDAEAEIELASDGLNLDPAAMEQAEERLFALRALARKHTVAVDDLPALRQQMEAKLAQLNDGADALSRLQKEAVEAREAYIAAAARLTRARKKAAAAMKAEVEKELPALMLDKTKFEVCFEALDENGWGPDGAERLGFQVQTNPNTNPGPIGRVASGGELARIMLAIKVVLAATGGAATLIFDEVDAGIGGAAAAAVGERLARLAETFQVLVVTHSPQVAARGQSHWRITKQSSRKASATEVANLGAADRIEEIARMLAGAQITDEARAAAASLIAGEAGGER